MRQHRIASVAPVLLALNFIAGCSAGTGSITGEVKHKGQPLTGAIITFYDAADKPISDTVKEDGTYELKKVAAGLAKIAITTPFAIDFESGGLPGGKSAANSEPKKTLPTLPTMYADREKSGLTFTVKSGAQVHNILLD